MTKTGVKEVIAWVSSGVLSFQVRGIILIIIITKGHHTDRCRDAECPAVLGRIPYNKQLSGSKG